MVVSPILTSIGSSEQLRSIEDQAELLLSISDIARSEITAFPKALQDNNIPPFPAFGGESSTIAVANLTPRTEGIRDLLFPSLQQHADSGIASSKRLRSVSIDVSPKKHRRRAVLNNAPHRATTPPAAAASLDTTPIVSPSRTPRPCQFRSARLSLKARRNQQATSAQDEDDDTLQSNCQLDNNNKTETDTNTGGTKSPLQAKPPKGIPIVKIRRRKFSWKNYPELEEFLVANREEYLRHSALNYTLQQKQYNNRLTERLLELSTSHGYVFDTHDFGFVTVRDRIRCYYKSYVQSAKKRGVLMGYAARKAGLLSEADLHAGQEGEIVMPLAD